MTWLFVRISPSVETIIPVPWSSTGPLLPKSPLPVPLASMDTTWGSTFCTICGMDAPPANAGPGVAPPTVMRVLGEELVPTASATAAPTPAPSTADTTATTSHCGGRRLRAGDGDGDGVNEPGVWGGNAGGGMGGRGGGGV